jgi:hypothetical protein
MTNCLVIIRKFEHVISAGDSGGEITRIERDKAVQSDHGSSSRAIRLPISMWPIRHPLSIVLEVETQGSPRDHRPPSPSALHPIVKGRASESHCGHRSGLGRPFPPWQSFFQRVPAECISLFPYPLTSKPRPYPQFTPLTPGRASRTLQQEIYDETGFRQYRSAA